MQAPETRSSLLVQLRDGSHQQAWNEFVEIYEPVVYRMARRRGLQHADAQDLVQEVFVSVSKAIERFDPGRDKGTFRGWLFRIARNAITNAVTRPQGTAGSGKTDVLALLHEQPAKDEQVVSQFEMERRRSVFRWASQHVQSTVSNDTWAAFWLTVVEGRSDQEVAMQFDKTPGAVRIARCRVLAKLREQVAELDQAD